MVVSSRDEQLLRALVVRRDCRLVVLLLGGELLVGRGGIVVGLRSLVYSRKNVESERTAADAVVREEHAARWLLARGSGRAVTWRLHGQLGVAARLLYSDGDLAPVYGQCS